VDEAIRGEDYAIEDYEKAIDNTALKPDHQRILSDHLKSIKSSKEQLTRIKSSLA